MMRQLIRKELRAVAPALMLAAAIWLVDFVFVMGTEFLDMPDASPQSEFVVEWVLWIVLVAFLIAAGQTGAEARDGTLKFLDTLPVGRTRVLLAKWCAGAGAIVLMILPLRGYDLLQHAWTKTSLDAPLHAGAQMGVLAQLLIVAIAIYSVALMISLAGRWYALVSAAVIWGFMWLREADWKVIAYVDPSRYLGAALADPPAPIAWRQSLLYAGIAVTAVALVTVGFSQLNAWPGGGGLRSPRRRALAAGAARIGTWLLPVIWIVGMVALGDGDSDPGTQDERHPGGEAAFQRQETRYYEFVYRTSQKADAKALIAAADSICEAVAWALQCPPLDIRIVADLGGESREGVLGDARWTKIRIPLERALGDSTVRAVLAHETAHVYVEKLSKGAMAKHWASTRFAHEGLATFVEHQLYPAGLEELRRYAAAIEVKDPVPFDLLSDDERLCEERDDAVVYALGESFFRALVDAYGKDAPARLLGSMARPGARHDLTGAAWWYDTAQGAGIDLERVLGRQAEATRDFAHRERDLFERIPQLSAVVGVRGSHIVIRPVFDGEAPGPVVCRLPGDGAGRLFTAEGGNEILIPRHLNPEPRIRYALGWVVPGMWRTLYGRWETAVLDEKSMRPRSIGDH